MKKPDYNRIRQLERELGLSNEPTPEHRRARKVEEFREACPECFAPRLGRSGIKHVAPCRFGWLTFKGAG